MAFYGGVEGGASHSKAVILDQNGVAVAWADGLDTNVWQIGTEEVCKRINTMVLEAKTAAGIDKDCKLKSLGMCLSGGEQEAQNKKLIECFKSSYAHLSEKFIIKTDTFGSIATACEKGGIILISGTGTNCQLVNPNESTFRCGGWGHMLGDEGGAYWISHRALKYYFDNEDGLKKSPHDTTFVKNAMKKYYGVSDQYGLLDHLYTNFKKPFFSGFCKVLAVEGAIEAKDPLCQHVFCEAGRVLAQHVIAVLPNADKALIEQAGGLQIVCVGSVFKSWDLLKPGFVEQLKQSKVEALTLVELTQSSAIGSALIGVNSISAKIPMNLQANFKVLEKINL